MSSVESGAGKALSPDWRVSKMGYEFDVYSSVWRLDGSTNLHWDWLSAVPQNETCIGLRQALAHYAEEASGHTIANVVTELRAYLRLTGSIDLTVEGLTDFKNGEDHKDEQRLGRLRAFLLAWHDWGFAGIGKDIVQFLEELTLRGNVKGAAVKGRCPYTGPLSSVEQGAVMVWAANAFNVGEVTLRSYALLMALMLTGRRPIQMRHLRACDLVAREDGRGNDYVLRVPRAKQRGGSFRSQLRSVPITEDLYLLLHNLATEVRGKVENAVGGRVPENVAQRLPIFIENSRCDELSDLEELQMVLRSRPDYLQMSSAAMETEMRRIRVANRAMSERTGDYIHITSRRFRYTKGTNLSNRGITGTALAYALDHTDTQNVGVYVENTPKAAEYIDEIMAPALAPLAQAFAGTLVRSEREATRANDPHSRINNGQAHNIGNCGTFAFCASGYRACYTCVNFQPWRDAPHHEVRDEVLAERERQKELGVSPAVIAATDRLLLAVEEVKRMCDEAKENEGVIDG